MLIYKVRGKIFGSKITQAVLYAKLEKPDVVIEIYSNSQRVAEIKVWDEDFWKAIKAKNNFANLKAINYLTHLGLSAKLNQEQTEMRKDIK